MPSLGQQSPAPSCIIYNRFWAWMSLINPLKLSCSILHHSQQILSKDLPRQSAQTLLHHVASFTTDSEHGSASSTLHGTPAPFCIIHNRFWAWICLINPPWTLLHHFASFTTDSEHGSASSTLHGHSYTILHHSQQILSMEQPSQPSTYTLASPCISDIRFWACSSLVNLLWTLLHHPA